MGRISIDDDIGRSNNRWLSFIDLIYFIQFQLSLADTNKFIFNAQAFNQQLVVDHSAVHL
jgi:hypothetical protein